MRVPGVRWWLVSMLALLVAVGALAAACGGSKGGSDEAKIRSRLDTFVNHFNKGDANGIISDIAPDQRKGCDPKQIEAAFAMIKGFTGGQAKITLKDVKIKSISGNTADVDVTSVLEGVGSAPATPETSSGKMSKSGGNWYIDTEGQGCQGLNMSGS